MDLNSSGSSSEETGEKSDGLSITVRRGKGRRGRQRSISPIVPLENPQEGDVVWAKVKNHRWWPAILINKEDCGKLTTVGGRKASFYVYWYGDGRVSPIAMSQVVNFLKGYHKFIMPKGSRSFENGVFSAILDIRKSHELDSDDWDIKRTLAWAEEGFPLPDGCALTLNSGLLSQHVREKVQKLRVKYEENEDSSDENEEPDSTLYLNYTKTEVDLIHSVRDGETNVNEICMACISKVSDARDHPLFYGSICDPCMDKFIQNSFSVGLDLISFHCSICMNLGNMMVCGKPSCNKAYCRKCIVMKATLGVIDNIRESSTWICFLCKPFSTEMHGLLKPRISDWKRNMWQLHHAEIPDTKTLKKSPLNILCLDGSCKTTLKVLQILDTLGMKVRKIFLCNFKERETKKLGVVLPNRISHLKSMSKLEDYEALSRITPIQLVIGSSGEQEKETFGSYFFSFFNMVSILKTLNQACLQSSVPLMWLFEAAPPYWQDYHILMSRYLQFYPAKWSKKASNEKNPNPVWTNCSPLWGFLEDEVPPEKRSGQRGRPSLQDREKMVDLEGAKRKKK